MIRILAEKRRPMNELDSTMDVPIPNELARYCVQNMDIMAGTDREVVYTGRFWSQTEPGARVDLVVKDERPFLRFSPVFGPEQYEDFIRTLMAQPMIVQMPMRMCA